MMMKMKMMITASVTSNNYDAIKVKNGCDDDDDRVEQSVDEKEENDDDL